MYTGITIISFTVDTSNIGFHLPIIILFPSINAIAEFETKMNQYINLFILLFFLLFLRFLSNSRYLSFTYYECLIIDLSFILLIYIPSFHRTRTAFFSFLFSISGSIHSILSLFYLIFPIPLFPTVIILPFLIKIPTFPFYYRLPEVHCEANTAIPLFPAGLSSKLSILGLIRPISASYYSSLRFLSSIPIYITLTGTIIINRPYYRYFDLKKIIALSSILHPNLTYYSLLSPNSIGIFCAIITSLPHSLSSIGPSLTIGLLINKTNTRLLDALVFIGSILRLLLSFLLPANNSFPSPINSTGEIPALSPIISIDALFSLFILFLSFLSIYFRSIVSNRKLPYPLLPYYYSVMFYYAYYLASINYSVGFWGIIRIQPNIEYLILRFIIDTHYPYYSYSLHYLIIAYSLAIDS